MKAYHRCGSAGGRGVVLYWVLCQRRLACRPASFPRISCDGDSAEIYGLFQNPRFCNAGISHPSASPDPPKPPSSLFPVPFEAPNLIVSGSHPGPSRVSVSIGCDTPHVYRGIPRDGHTAPQRPKAAQPGTNPASGPPFAASPKATRAQPRQRFPPALSTVDLA